MKPTHMQSDVTSTDTPTHPEGQNWYKVIKKHPGGMEVNNSSLTRTATRIYQPHIPPCC